VAARPDDPRAAAILAAAFEAFVEGGVAATTTLDIARRARVSKREIYALFGSREALFAALVRRRAQVMRQALALSPAMNEATLLETLERFGREFLGLLLQPTTVAVYRRAAAEAGRLPELGRALDEEGRGGVVRALGAWLGEAREAGVLPATDPERAGGSFLALLIGDLPLRLTIGAIRAPGPEEIARRAAAARAAFARLWL